MNLGRSEEPVENARNPSTDVCAEMILVFNFGVVKLREFCQILLIYCYSKGQYAIYHC